MANSTTMYNPPKPGSKIIIVGGGAFGLSTAYALALKNKYDVWVYDRQSIPAPDAASTDINKIVRIDYAAESLYMQMAIEALPLWRQWNKERAEMGLSPVFHETGVLLFSQNGKFSDYEIQSMKAIREAGYGHLIEELTDPETIVKRYPQFKDAVANGFNIAYLNRAGGWCDSAEAVKHMYYKCQQNGVHFVLGEQQGCLEKLVTDPSDASKIIGIQTKDNKVHKADHIVLATGAWSPGLVDLNNKLIATGQTVIHFQLPPELRKKFENQPVWAGDLSRTGIYGFPINSEGKMKIGLHSRGYLNPREIDGVSIPRTQVTHKTDTIPRKALREFRTFLSKFLPVTSKLDVSFARVCWYCDSIDGHFLISPHPRYQNLIIASGDSGHGMKFIPNIGFKICHVIEGLDSDYSRTWRWRDMPELATYDGLRAESHHQQQLHLGLESDANVAMATAEDFLAVKANL